MGISDVENREDLAFNHQKPKKSETSELEESEQLLVQLCDIASVGDQFIMNNRDRLCVNINVYPNFEHFRKNFSQMLPALLLNLFTQPDIYRTARFKLYLINPQIYVLLEGNEAATNPALFRIFKI